MERKYKRPEDAPQEYWGQASGLDVPVGSEEFLSIPRVCVGRGSYSNTDFVYTIVSNKNSTGRKKPFFLWALYRHAFEVDESLPRLDAILYKDRHITMEDVVRYVEEGKLAECAIPLAMEVLL